MTQRHRAAVDVDVIVGQPQFLQSHHGHAGERLVDLEPVDVLRRELRALEREAPGWNERFGIGQITAACVLGYLDFRFPAEDWRGSGPALAQWYEGIARRPSVKATVPA